MYNIVIIGLQVSIKGGYMATQGYGLFTTEPNVHQSLKCNICGAECLVERDLPVPLGFVASMSAELRKKPRDKFYDEFSCPNLKSKWHKQAVKLVKEIRKTPSKRLAQLMQQDLEDLLLENNSY